MIGALLLVLLLAHAGAHVTLVAALARRTSALRSALAFVITPLAPYFGFNAGVRRRAWAWIGTLAVYAVAVGVVRGC